MVLTFEENARTGSFVDHARSQYRRAVGNAFDCRRGSDNIGVADRQRLIVRDIHHIPVVRGLPPAGPAAIQSNRHKSSADCSGRRRTVIKSTVSRLPPALYANPFEVPGS